MIKGFYIESFTFSSITVGVGFSIGDGRYSSADNSLDLAAVLSSINMMSFCYYLDFGSQFYKVFFSF
jgi:hypothetical protein